MNRYRKTAMLALVCGAITAIAYFAYKFPFFEYAEEIYTTSKDRLFTAEWFSRLMPFVIILALKRAPPRGVSRQPAPKHRESACPGRSSPFSWLCDGCPCSCSLFS